MHIRIRLGATFLGAMALLGQLRERVDHLWRGKFASENAMAFLGEVRES